MNLKKVGCIKVNGGTRISVCIEETTGVWYTLWEIEEHAAARIVMELQLAEAFAQCYLDGESLCMAFPYEEPRPLERFYHGSMYGYEERRQIYQNIVAACAAAGLPYPILYLLLRKNCLNIRKDNSIFFTYYIYPNEISPEQQEEQCVRICAEQLAVMMEQGGKEEGAGISLLRKKLRRNAYHSFPQLYQDLRLADSRKNGLLKKMRPNLKQDTKDRVFRILLAATIVIAVLAAMLFVSQAISGDVPILRVFTDSFKHIGEGLHYGN